jgi:hypothetical protein
LINHFNFEELSAVSSSFNVTSFWDTSLDNPVTGESVQYFDWHVVIRS